MTTTQIVFIALAGALLLAALGAFAIAYRQSGKEEEWRRGIDRDARKADVGVPAGVAAAVAAGSAEAVQSESATAVADESAPQPEAEAETEAPTVVRAVEAQRVVEIDPEEAGVLRRQFLTRALTATFFTSLGVFGMASLAFAWPRISGGFGADVDAGDVDDIRNSIFNPDGSITPLFWPEAKSWIVPISDEERAGSQFAEDPVAAGGLMALWQKCVHLGCRVPWCQTSQGFECPCHGSKYNYVGEYEAGPAPRNLDRFVVEVNDNNRFIIRTSLVIPTERAQVKTVEYPLGPSCITIAAPSEEA